MKILVILTSLAALSLPAIAQTSSTCSTATIPVCSQPTGVNAVQVKPQAIPNVSAGTVTTIDAYLKILTVTNTTAGALTVTVADRQGTPVALLKTYSIAANGEQTFMFDTPYWLPSGFTVLASGAGLTFCAAWSH
jgi:hypothetical protein